MEVPTNRVGPGFKGEDSWKYRKVFDDKHTRKLETKVEQRLAPPIRESGHRKLYVLSGDSLEGKPPVARSMARMTSEHGSAFSGSQRRPEMPQESTDEQETSQDMHLDDSDDSIPDEPATTRAPEATTKWPIIQIVDPPAWLPGGWTAVLRTRESGSKDKYYVDPVSQRRFRSKTEVNYFLQTGKSYRYKRNLALLTKPLKEDPVSLPSSVPMRNIALDMPSHSESVQNSPYINSSAANGGEFWSSEAASSKPAQGPDLRLSIRPQPEPLRKLYKKPGQGSKPKIFPEDLRKSSLPASPRRNVVEEKKVPEGSQGQGTQNRGKLILKLKRKPAGLDEVQKHGKKPRPFEVVGATPVLCTLSEDEDTHERSPCALDHAVETIPKVPHTMVPSNLVSRKPLTKAPPAGWQYQPQSSSLGRPQYGRGENHVEGSHGQGHGLERTSTSVTWPSTDPENAKLPHRRESPAEQLQRLGKRLCQQAVAFFTSDHGGSNTLQQISRALHTAMNPVGSSSLNSQFNSAFIPSLGAEHQPPYRHQHHPVKRIRGSVSKEKAVFTMR